MTLPDKEIAFLRNQLAETLRSVSVEKRRMIERNDLLDALIDLRRVARAYIAEGIPEVDQAIAAVDKVIANSIGV